MHIHKVADQTVAHFPEVRRRIEDTLVVVVVVAVRMTAAEPVEAAANASLNH